jgi:hypothetical protein
MFEILSNDPKTRQKLREFSNWSAQMVQLLTQLICGLSDTVRAWEEFQRNDIWYFIDGESPTTSSHLESSVRAVSKTFSHLHGILQKLQELKKELCKDNPQGVSHPPTPMLKTNCFRAFEKCKS